MGASGIGSFAGKPGCFIATAAERKQIAKLVAAARAQWAKDGVPHGVAAQFDSVLKIGAKLA